MHTRHMASIVIISGLLVLSAASASDTVSRIQPLETITPAASDTATRPMMENPTFEAQMDTVIHEPPIDYSTPTEPSSSKILSTLKVNGI